MEQKSRQTTHIRIIYGKRGLKSDEREWIDSIPSIELCFRETLHAKLYLNEKQAVLTSMNLYQFSEKNNDEMGILVSKNARIRSFTIREDFEGSRAYCRPKRKNPRGPTTATYSKIGGVDTKNHTTGTVNNSRDDYSQRTGTVGQFQ